MESSYSTFDTEDEYSRTRVVSYLPPKEALDFECNYPNLCEGEDLYEWFAGIERSEIAYASDKVKIYVVT